MKNKQTLLERANRMSKRLRKKIKLSEIERTFMAISLAASPEERWEINRFFVQRLPPVACKAMEMEVLQSANAQFKR
jgi:hypothetical protein